MEDEIFLDNEDNFSNVDVDLIDKDFDDIDPYGEIIESHEDDETIIDCGN